MEDLKEATFVIPLRIDSYDRITDTNLLIEYLLDMFRTNILIIEDDIKPLFECPSNKQVKYIFNYNDSLFSMSKVQNLGAKATNTPVIICHAADVLLQDRSKYILMVDLINKDSYDLIYPFEYYLSLTRERSDIIRETKQVGIKPSDYYIPPCPLSPDNLSCGAIIGYNKKTFFYYGGWHEGFKGWGKEDPELYWRFLKLGARIKRLSGNVLHLEHERGISSQFANPYELNNTMLFKQTLQMDHNKLRKLVNEWSWINE